MLDLLGNPSLMFPKVPLSSLGILRVPQEHPLPLNTPGPLKEPYKSSGDAEKAQESMHEVQRLFGAPRRWCWWVDCEWEVP